MEELPINAEIKELKQENIALKLRIKKLETDLKHYEQKLKEWEPDTDALIKALGDVWALKEKK